MWLLYQQANGIRLKEVAKLIALGDTGPLTLLAFRPQLFVSGETTEQAPDQASTNTTNKTQLSWVSESLTCDFHSGS